MQSESPRKVDAWPRCERASEKCLSKNKKKLIVDKFGVANLRSYPLNCTAASWDFIVKIFPKNTAAIYLVFESK